MLGLDGLVSRIRRILKDLYTVCRRYVFSLIMGFASAVEVRYIASKIFREMHGYFKLRYADLENLEEHLAGKGFRIVRKDEYDAEEWGVARDFVELIFTSEHQTVTVEIIRRWVTIYPSTWVSWCIKAGSHKECY